EQIERGNYDWIADKARLMLERANTPTNS
ncbi:MAG: hypothetical protein K0R75_3051, partial [Paenibacillaceae bacterium]|nr:hypothetical protein [Paenibacillaceae bacterium]